MLRFIVSALVLTMVVIIAAAYFTGRSITDTATRIDQQVVHGKYRSGQLYDSERLDETKRGFKQVANHIVRDTHEILADAEINISDWWNDLELWLNKHS